PLEDHGAGVAEVEPAAPPGEAVGVGEEGGSLEGAGEAQFEPARPDVVEAPPVEPAPAEGDGLGEGNLPAAPPRHHVVAIAEEGVPEGGEVAEERGIAVCAGLVAVADERVLGLYRERSADEAEGPDGRRQVEAGVGAPAEAGGARERR